MTCAKSNALDKVWPGTCLILQAEVPGSQVRCISHRKQGN